MGHRLLSTDNGVQCFACGMVLDYLNPEDAETVVPTSLVADERTEMAATLFLPNCPGPVLNRAHHWVFEGDRIECAYADATIGAETPFDSVTLECVGG